MRSEQLFDAGVRQRADLFRFSCAFGLDPSFLFLKTSKQAANFGVQLTGATVSKEALERHRFPWRLARIMLLLVVGLIFLVMALEDKLIYFPTKYPDGFWEVESFRSRERQVVPKIEDCYSRPATVCGFMAGTARRIATLPDLSFPLSHKWSCCGFTQRREHQLPIRNDSRDDGYSCSNFIIDYRATAGAKQAFRTGVISGRSSGVAYLIGNRGIPANT